MENVLVKKLRLADKKFIVHVIFILLFAGAVLAPLIAMFSNITASGIREVFKSRSFLPALNNSLLTAITASVISIVLAMLAAFCLERVCVRAKSVWGILFVLPMLIPSFSHAFGLITLFGKNGIITNIFHFNSNLYGFWGIVLGSVMYSFPVAFLMISGMLRYEDGMQHNAAKILGISSPRRFFSLTLPYLKKTLISAFFAVFTMVITDYGVPLTIGGKTVTLSVMMYNKAAANANYNAGSVIGAVLLIPAIIAFVADLLNPDGGQSGFICEPMDRSDDLKIKIPAYVFCVLLSVFVLLPILAFCIMSFASKFPVDMSFTFKHIADTFSKGGGEFLFNSLLYAVMVAVIGTISAFFCAYAASRLKCKLSKPLHLVSILSMAIPGIVLGLSYVIFFHNTAIYGTVIIVVLVNSVHFFSSPYLMIYNTLVKVNGNIEDVGRSLGISRIRIIFSVIIPKVFLTLLEMFVYFFVNAMMTISAISFLMPPSPKSLALMINQFEAQSLVESAAFVSLLILAVNLILKVVLTVVKHKNSEQKD